MVSACVFTVLLEYPGSPVYQAIADPFLRRALIGLAMAATAITIVYSGWGKQSGAHFNPAVTLAFLRLKKIAPWDAAFYIVAQFAGCGSWRRTRVFVDRHGAGAPKCELRGDRARPHWTWRRVRG